MKPAIVKWTVDLFAPGAILSTQLTKWFIKSRWEPHSRRIIWPVKDLNELLDIDADGSKALEDFTHVRATPIMDGWDGATDGDLDRLLTTSSVDKVFDMPRITGLALTLAPPYRLNKSFVSWLELYEMEEETIKFIRQTSVEEIAQLLKEAPRS